MVNNVIYNSDCIEGLRSLENNSIHMILTDIPYGNVSRNGEERAKYGGQLRKIDKGNADVETFDLQEFLNEVYRVCSGSFYIFCGIEQVSDVFRFFDEKKDVMTRHCIWHKNNPSPSNGQHFWLNATENCIFAKKRKTTFNRSCEHNVWNFPIVRKKIHPTQKSLELFKYLIESSTNEGDIVVDPCMGSATTAIASIETGRKYIGWELDNTYYKDSLKRISDTIFNRGGK